MLRFGRKRLADAGHLTDKDLILCLDGELNSRDSRRAISHLDSCWSCRARQRKMEAAIAGVVEDRNAAAAAVKPPKGWREFDPRLDRLAAESEPVHGRLLPSGLQIKFASVLLVAGALLLWVNSGGIETVSAKELLTRAEDADTDHLRHVPEPVLHQKLRIRRTGVPPVADGTDTVETWYDIRNGKTAWRGSGGWKELEGVLDANGMPSRLPLSAKAYRSWRKANDLESETVEKTSLPGGVAAYELKAVSAGLVSPGRISENRLVVRATDWHPVYCRLRVRAGYFWRDYEISEVAFEIVARNSLPATIFEPPSVPEPHAVPAVARPEAPPVPLASPLADLKIDPSRVEAAEMEARYALHRRGECLAGTVQVVRKSAGEVAVNGFVATARDKAALLEALAGIPLITVDIRSVEQMAEPLPPEDAPAVPAAGDGPEEKARTRATPLEEQLSRYLALRYGGGDMAGKVTAFSNEVVSLQQSIRRDAWALRRLAERYGPDRLAPLPPGSRRLLDAMVREHMRVLRVEMEHSRSLLEPALAGFKDGSGEAEAATLPQRTAADLSWSAACLSLADLVEQTGALAEGLFAGTSPASDAARAAALLENLARADSRFEALEQRAAAEILSRGTLTYKNF